jgi:hypothetical protein
MAYPGEQPIITGGKAITGWTTSDAGNGIYSANGVTTPFRQLYVNGVKAIRREPPTSGQTEPSPSTGSRRRQRRAEHPGGGLRGGELEQLHSRPRCT